MKKMMTCLVLAIAVLTVAGTAWSWDFADHVKVAPNGQGDYLFYPYYLALGGGWETKIWVVNTSPNRSVVAHIAFYSARTSREMLDFFLFLTPTDVWSGTVRVNATSGKVELYSEDESALVDNPNEVQFASKTTPIIKEINSPVGSTCVGNPEPYGTNLGYVKVIEQAHSDGIAGASYSAGNLNAPGVAKTALYQAFNDFLAAANLTTGLGSANASTNPLVMDGINVLTGYLELRNTMTGQDATVNATVLRDYDNQAPVTYGQSFGFNTNCQGIQGFPPPPSLFPDEIGNSGCQIGGGPIAGGPTTCPIGTVAAKVNCGCTANGLGCQNNSIGEVEAALAKDWVSMPYNSKTSTLHFLTFPTKQTLRDSTDCYYTGSPSPFFNETGRVTVTAHPSTYTASWENWGCVTYQGMNFDTSEKSSSVTTVFSPSTSVFKLCGEMNVAAGFAFDEGWAVYNFSSSSLSSMSSYVTRFDVQANIVPAGYDAWYTGAPVIGTVLYFGPNGLTTLPASYADGSVWYNKNAVPFATNVTSADSTRYYYYQYWDEANNGNGYDVDETGCWDTATLPLPANARAVACGTPTALAVGAMGTGSNNIYGNKFSGNRAEWNQRGIFPPAPIGRVNAAGVTDGQRPVQIWP